jgi:hypothetical protein
VTLKNDILWDVAPCRSSANRRFEGTLLHIQEDVILKIITVIIIITIIITITTIILTPTNLGSYKENFQPFATVDFLKMWNFTVTRYWKKINFLTLYQAS